jgi:hypothetical protein
MSAESYRYLIWWGGDGMAEPGACPPAAVALVEDLGRELGIAGLALDDDGVATLRIDEIVVSLAVDGDGLTLFAPLTEVAVADRSSLSRALMANFLWTETDGATLALEPHSRQLVLQRHLPLDRLDYPVFVVTLERFTALAEHWAAVLRQELADDQALTPPVWGALRA